MLYLLLLLNINFNTPDLYPGELKPLLNTVDHNIHSDRYRQQQRVFHAKEQIPQIYLDPKISLKVQNLPYNLSYDSPMSGNMIGVTQMIPYPGKIDAAKGVIRERGNLTAIQLNQYRGKQKMLITRQYHLLALQQQELKWINATIENYRSLKKLLEGLYPFGKVSRSKLLEVDYLIEQSLIRQNRVHRKITTTENRLKQLTYLKKLPRFQFQQIQFNPETTPLPKLDHNRLQPLKIVAQQNRILKEQKKVIAFENYSDFTIGFSWLQRFESMMSNGDDLYSIQFSFNLPFLNSRSNRKKRFIVQKQHQNRLIHNAILSDRHLEFNRITDQISSDRKLLNHYQKRLKPLLDQQLTLKQDDLGYNRSNIEDLILLHRLIFKLKLEQYSLKELITTGYFNLLLLHF